MEQIGQQVGVGVGFPGMIALANVARATGQCQVQIGVRATGPGRDDVFDLKRKVEDSLGRAAVFTTVTSPLGNGRVVRIH